MSKAANTEVVASLKKFLKQAQAGDISGIVMVAQTTPKEDVVGDVRGTLKVEHVVGMLEKLKFKMLRQVED